jgi:hypothetical protein
MPPNHGEFGGGSLMVGLHFFILLPLSLSPSSGGHLPITGDMSFLFSFSFCDVLTFWFAIPH